MHNVPFCGTIEENMYKLVIFDLDGTLLDTMEDLANGVNHALASCGVRTIDVEECRKLVGNGVRNLLRGALPLEVRTEEMLARMEESFFPYYTEHMSDFTKPYEGIPEALKRLSSEGIMLAVASNKFQKGTEELIERFFGDIPFVKVLGQREGYPIKPDAAVVYEAIEAASVTKEEVIYCGDSDVDMMTGNNAGVKTLGVTWGFRSKEQLLEHNPWKIIDSTSEIADSIL